MWNRLRCMLTQRLNRTMGKNDINIEEMQKMIRQGATLVDVRSPQEYKEGHLKKAKLIPEYEIIKTCKYELKDKDNNDLYLSPNGNITSEFVRWDYEPDINEVINLIDNENIISFEVAKAKPFMVKVLYKGYRKEI